MRYVSWAITLIFFGAIATVLLYTLPRHDVVRIVGSEVRRIDFGSNSIFWSNSGGGNATDPVSRDVFFIETIQYRNMRPLIYRNEDTGLIWPPYFKLNAANLQARASDLVSTKDAPRWVMVRSYGWRFELLSIYPNAVRIWPVEDPEARHINWFNIVFLTVFGAIGWSLWRRWRRFRERRIDPMIDQIDEGIDSAGLAVAARGRRIRRWFDSWRH